MAGDHSRDREVFESVPWEQLVDLRPDRRRWIYAGAGLAIVALLAFGIARTFRPEPETMMVAPTSPVATSVVESTAGSGSSPAATEAPVASAPESAMPAPGIYAESDLMAAGAPGDSSLAAAVAEWFMVDWLTVDGSSDAGEWSGAVSQRPSDEGVRSYVEWLGATSVEEIRPAVHQVEVIVRRLASSDGTTYRRVPATAYRVIVDLTSGSPGVSDLPSRVPLPVTEFGRAWGDPASDAAEPVVAAAAAAAGVEVTDVIGIWPIDDLWRVVVGVADATGVVWPESVWLDQDGNAVAPQP